MTDRRNPKRVRREINYNEDEEPEELEDPAPFPPQEQSSTRDKDFGQSADGDDDSSSALSEEPVDSDTSNPQVPTRAPRIARQLQSAASSHPDTTSFPAQHSTRPRGFGIRPIDRLKVTNEARAQRKIDEGLRVKPGVTLNYQPVDTRKSATLGAHHISEATVHQNRAFELVEPITIQEGTVGRAKTFVRWWDVKIRDQNSGTLITPYWNETDHSSSKQRAKGVTIPAGSLTVEVFPNEADVRIIGQLLADTTNRLHHDVPRGKWLRKKRLDPVIAFIETVATLRWDINFDLDKIRSYAQAGEVLRYGKQSTYSEIKQGASGDYFDWPPFSFCPRISARDKKTIPEVVQVVANTIDSQKVANEVIIAPNSPWAVTRKVKETGGPGMKKQADTKLKFSGGPGTVTQRKSTEELLKFMQLQMVGLVGSVREVRERIAAIRQRCLRASSSHTARAPLGHAPLVSVGSLNGRSLFVLPRLIGDRTTVLSSPAMLDLLESPNLAGLSGWLQTYVSSNNTVLAAFVYQAALDRLAATQAAGNCDLIAAWQAANRAADRIKSGSTTVEFARTSLLGCSQTALHMHSCMLCGKEHLCSTMKVDTVFRRRICEECHSKPSTALSEWRQITMDIKLWRLHQSAWTRDSLIHEPPWTKLELRDELRRQIISPKSYTNAYGRDRTATLPIINAGPHGEPLSARGFHPLQPSVEKVYALCLWEGVVAFHAPINTVLVPYALNLLKHAQPVHIMALVEPMRRLTLANSTPNTGYTSNSDVRLRIDSALDNLYMIGRCLPRYNRLLLEISDTRTIQAHQVQSRTGRFDAASMTPVRARQLYFTRARLRQWLLSKSTGAQPYAPWTDQEKEMIGTMITLMENEAGLKVPRYRDGAPHLFRNMPGPTNNDGWDWFYEEMWSRFNTMVLVCNKHHLTEESLLTFCLEIIKQWLETGGKCPYFGQRLVAFCRHAMNYSVGRAFHRLDSSGRPTIPIAAGDAMFTGWSVREPQSLDDYDYSRRTVQLMSWTANSFFWEFPTAQRSMRTMDTLALSVAHETEWYDRLQQDYPVISFPQTFAGIWFPYSFYRQQFLQVQAPVEEGALDVDDMEDLDEDIARDNDDTQVVEGPDQLDDDDEYDSLFVPNEGAGTENQDQNGIKGTTQTENELHKNTEESGPQTTKAVSTYPDIPDPPVVQYLNLDGRTEEFADTYREFQDKDADSDRRYIVRPMLEILNRAALLARKDSEPMTYNHIDESHGTVALCSDIVTLVRDGNSDLDPRPDAWLAENMIDLVMTMVSRNRGEIEPVWINSRTISSWILERQRVNDDPRDPRDNHIPDNDLVLDEIRNQGHDSFERPIKKVVTVLGSGTHFMAVLIDFSDANQGFIQIWDSMELPGPNEKRESKRFQKLLDDVVRFVEHVLDSGDLPWIHRPTPTSGFPHRIWSQPEVMPQNQQPFGSVDCGVYAAQAAEHLLRQEKVRLLPESEIPSFGYKLRYKYFRMIWSLIFNSELPGWKDIETEGEAQSVNQDLVVNTQLGDQPGLDDQVQHEIEAALLQAEKGRVERDGVDVTARRLVALTKSERNLKAEVARLQAELEAAKAAEGELMDLTA
ncbi:hypothetical protein BDZ85DRAFT_293400 [Elsinoe ampelina]|uniref:Ubiquitin-like protease family profile domain-containing protein n=1 Tax=Elsinoe ampelina TaxID=302913 RepID=A0A6A6GLN7_9PEZI|nr:hypothetical protein BDZ85DRAFT_293400 [Elsinoe ampelina]